MAVQAILARNGIVEYDYKYDAAGNRRLPKGTMVSGRLQKALGDDNFLHHVAVVGLDLDKSGNRVYRRMQTWSISNDYVT